MPRTNSPFPAAAVPISRWIATGLMKQKTDQSQRGERRRNRLTVLVADDDPAQRQEIREYLTRLGIQVLEAEDGIEAVAQIDRYNPALVVMDIRMPHCDGIRAAEIALSLSPRTLVILMSGHPEELRRAEASGCGAYTLLQKPIGLSRLGDHVSVLIG